MSIHSCLECPFESCSVADHECTAVAQRKAWGPLLEILGNSGCPVGEAIHWVETQGIGMTSNPRWTSATTKGKRRKVCDLWRFVPEVLAADVLVVAKKDEAKTATGALGNCMWIQTLPSAMQANILSFLSVEHLRFRVKDLELLARGILSSTVELDFWVLTAAQTLLSTSLEGIGQATTTFQEPCCSGRTNSEILDYHKLPDWLDEFVVQPNSFIDGLPLSRVSHQLKTRLFDRPDQDLVKSNIVYSTSAVHNQKVLDNSQNWTLDSEAQKTEKLIEKATVGSNLCSSSQVGNNEDNDDISMNSTLEEENVVINDELFISDLNAGDREIDLDKADKEVLGVEVFLKAKALREALLSHWDSTLLEEINLIRSSSNPRSFLAVMKAWEFEDEITLILIGSLLHEQDGLTWATQILGSVLLPKLLSLDKTPSRPLITAVLQAGRVHPRAVVESILLPVIYCKSGASNVHCEVINRVVKDCLPVGMTSFLCQKMFSNWEEVYEGNALNSYSAWVWTEGMVGVVQNLLNQKQDLDQKTIDGIVSSLDVAVTDFSASLKFGNLLLNLTTKYSCKLRLHKASLIKIAHKTKTFLAKSVLSKAAAL